METQELAIAGRVLEDRQRIAELIYAYCRAMDRVDAELGYSLWHPDGEADYGAIYRGSGRGFIDFVCEQHRRLMLAHSHQISNIRIVLNGDLAASESYVTARLRHAGDGRLLQTTVTGRYLDRWSRRAGRWAIDKRTFVLDFDDVREVTPTGMEYGGRRDREDPSYRVLELAAAEEMGVSK